SGRLRDRKRLPGHRHPGLRGRRARNGRQSCRLATPMKTIIALILALAAARPLGAQAPTSGLPTDLVKLLHDIKATDTDQLAVSEEDGRFLRMMAASTGAKQEIGRASCRERV